MSTTSTPASAARRWWTAWLRRAFAGSIYSCLVIVVVAHATLTGMLS